MLQWLKEKQLLTEEVTLCIKSCELDVSFIMEFLFCFCSGLFVKLSLTASEVNSTTDQTISVLLFVRRQIRKRAPYNGFIRNSTVR